VVIAPATTEGRQAVGPRSGACVACGAALAPAVPLGAVRLAACPACGSRTALPRPDRYEVTAFHDSAEYFDKLYFEARRGRDEEAAVRCRAILEAIRRATRDWRGEHRRWLDVGCDTGELLDAARTITGAEAYGVDVARRPVELAQQRGLDVEAVDLRDAPERFRDFGVVTAIDVIEHVDDPRALLAEAARRLAADGVVYIETPNWSSTVYGVGRVVQRLFRGRPRDALARLFPAEHVQYFTGAGLRAVAAGAGLETRLLFAKPLRGGAIAGGRMLRVALALLQLPDRLSDRGILLCAVLAPRSEAER
jgi:2-polyprenyl-3-methyl-5-hydroxy-6-metoxy-1,4-benzoquinol methylase